MQIFPNGTLFYQTSTAADLDADGFPISAGSSFSGECICTITTATEDRNATYEGGTVKRATYTVTCNMEDVEENFNPKSVKLTHEQKGELGTFQVQRIEYYTITQTIELWV